MSSGVEHYREAERLLEEQDYTTSADNLAAAQTHATLALVAALVDRETGTRAGQRAAAWREVTSRDA